LKRLLLTYADMGRLSKHFGYASLEEFRAKECVPVEFRFLGNAPMTIATASGWCLKRTKEETSEDASQGRPLQCRFLNAENRCSIYSVRPSPCRIYPYDVSYKTAPAMPHGMDIYATYVTQNDVDCKGFIAKKTIPMWLLKEPAREITRHLVEMQETVKQGFYELKTEVVGSMTYVPPYAQTEARAPFPF
jgi:Fe-S-cluster containining protein